MIPAKLVTGLNSNNYILGTPGDPHSLNKVIAYEQGKSVVYAVWSYESTRQPTSIPRMVASCCKDLEKSCSAIDAVVFGSRRWAEYTSAAQLPYRIVYDQTQRRDYICFIERGCVKGRLTIDDLPDEELVPHS